MEQALTYDDVLLAPQHSTIESRRTVDTSTELVPGIELDVPLVSAPMDSVTGTDLAQALADAGGIGILHRAATVDETISALSSVDGLVGASVGISESAVNDAKAFEYYGADVIVVDVAHGHLAKASDAVHEISNAVNVPVIAGNVATYQGAKELAQAGADGIKIGVGPGCFAAGTRVLMANGSYKNIEDVEKGDRVINKNGEPVSVKAAQKTGEREVIEVNTNKWHKSTYVTPDHQYWTGDLNSISESTLSSNGYTNSLNKSVKTGGDRYKWKEIGSYEQDVSLTPTDILFELEKSFEIPLKKRVGGNYVSGHEYEVDNILVNNYNTGYIFGTFLGDGTARIQQNSSGCISWCFGLDEKHIAQKLKTSLKEELDNVNVKIEETENTIDVIVYYTPLAKLLELFGKYNKKHLPEEYLVDDVEYLRGLFEGLVDSDGHISETRVGFTNTSEKLIELYNVLCNMLHTGFPNNRSKKKSIGNLSGASIDTVKQSYVSRWSINTENRVDDNNNQVIKVLDSSETGKVVPVYDIEVDCDTHSFIANNSVVHNSACTTRIKTGVGVPQFTAVRNAVVVRNQYDITIIADGGIREPGDAMKALAAGADSVMLGGEFAKCVESPEDGSIWGMASAQGKETHGAEGYVEGVSSAPMESTETVEEVVTAYTEGIQSGCSYIGAMNLHEARENAVFNRVTPAAYQRNGGFANE